MLDVPVLPEGHFDGCGPHTTVACPLLTVAVQCPLLALDWPPPAEADEEPEPALVSARAFIEDVRATNSTVNKKADENVACLIMKDFIRRVY